MISLAVPSSSTSMGHLLISPRRPTLFAYHLELVPLLARVSSGLEGALAIVTGRQIADINRFLDPFDSSLPAFMAPSYD